MYSRALEAKWRRRPEDVKGAHTSHKIIQAQKINRDARKAKLLQLSTHSLR